MRIQKILFSILAIFAVTMGFLLGASPAQATEVIRDGDSDSALGILGLTVRFADQSEAVYDVVFVYASPQALYGDPPGRFDFSSQSGAEDAVLAANAALNDAGIKFVRGDSFYSVGYNYLDSALDGPVVRAAQATNLWGLGWPIKDRDLEEVSLGWGDPDFYAKFIEVPGEKLAYVSTEDDCGGNTPCFANINTAIDNSESGSVIRITGDDYDENVALDTDKELTLSGGWDLDYSSQSSETIINSLSIEGGSLVIDSILMDGN